MDLSALHAETSSFTTEILAPEPTIEAEVAAENVIISMFDEYVRILHAPDSDADYKRTGYRREAILAMKIDDLKLYIKGSFMYGGLDLGTVRMPKKGSVTFDDVCDALIATGIETASQKYLKLQLAKNLPQHVTVIEATADAALTETSGVRRNRWGELLKRVITSGEPLYHSGEIALPTLPLPTFADMPHDH